MSVKQNTSTLLQKAVDTVKEFGVFRARDFVAAGFPREYLHRLVRRDQVLRLGRGLYVPATFDGDQNLMLVQAAQKIPRGVVCLFSALQFHRIGTQSPHQVWLAVPRDANFPRAGSLPLRFCKFSTASHAFGVEEHRLSGGSIRVFSPAKTVADCFKYRNKIGLDVALEALREFLSGGWGSIAELQRYAATCRVANVIRPYLQALTA